MSRTAGKHALAAAAWAAVAAAVSCKPAGESEKTFGPEEAIDVLPSGLDLYQRVIPGDNPLTREKVELGRHLYFDKRLSVDGTVSCATCHDPAKGWSNGEAVATGVKGQKGERSSPTVINRVFSTLQFWDGRAKSLEEQALGPIQNPIEMGETLENVVAKLKKIEGYKPLFAAAFGDSEVTAERIAKAIASFERTIVAGHSPFDRFEARDETALSESARRGREIFFDNHKGRCSICHSGQNFTDEKFHNLGVGWDRDPAKHMGRFEVTGDEKDKGGYKTPSLRNIAQTAPYMHDGSEATLEEVVEFYVKGGNKNDSLDPEMKPLNLTDEEKKDLVAFLEALTGQVTAVTVPEPLE